MVGISASVGFSFRNFRTRPCLSQLYFLHCRSSDVLLPENPQDNSFRIVIMYQSIRSIALHFLLVDISMAFVCFWLQGVRSSLGANWLHQMDKMDKAVSVQASKLGRNQVPHCKTECFSRVVSVYLDPLLNPNRFRLKQQNEGGPRVFVVKNGAP